MVPDLFTGLLKLAYSLFIYFFLFPSFHLFAWICRGACGGFWGEVLYCFHKCLVHQRGYPHHTLKQTEVTYFFPCFWGLYFYFSQDFVCRAVIMTEVSPVRPQTPGLCLSGWTMFPLSHSRELHSLHPARCLVACRGERNNLFKQRVRRKGKKKTYIILVLAIIVFLSDHQPISYQQLDSFSFFFLSFSSPLSEPILSHQNSPTDGQLQRRFPWDLSGSPK